MSPTASKSRCHSRMVGYVGLKFRVLRCSHEWLPLPDCAQDAAERQDVIWFWRMALGVVMTRPLTDLNRRDHQYRDEDVAAGPLERWRRGATASRRRAAEIRCGIQSSTCIARRTICQKIFSHSLHRHALRWQPTPITYVLLVRQIVQRAFVDVEGKRRWPWREKVWDALLGLDGYSAELWEPHHTDVREETSRMSFSFGWRMFRSTDIALTALQLGSVSRPPLLSGSALFRGFWDVFGSDESHHPRGMQEAEDAVARLLNVVWGEEHSLRAAPDAFEAFRGLLSWLGERQNAIGLELVGRIGSFG